MAAWQVLEMWALARLLCGLICFGCESLIIRRHRNMELCLTKCLPIKPLKIVFPSLYIKKTCSNTRHHRSTAGYNVYQFYCREFKSASDAWHSLALLCITRLLHIIFHKFQYKNVQSFNSKEATLTFGKACHWLVCFLLGSMMPWVLDIQNDSSPPSVFISSLDNINMSMSTPLRV